MDTSIDITALLAQLQQWATVNLLTVDSAIQLGWLILSLVMGYVLSRPINKRLSALDGQWKDHWYGLWIAPAQSIIAPTLSFIFLQFYFPIAAEGELSTRINTLFENLIGAWIVIRFASAFIRYPALARWLAVIVWSLAMLNSVGALEVALDQLDAIGLNIGDKYVSLLTIFKGLAAFAVVMWGANLLARISEKQIQQIDALTPSLRVLISKIVRTVFIIFAVVIGLNTLGIDLTSLAVFSGAIGVGIGFGLQKVVSNFISGIILLIDRSIKPGDVIAIDQTYGWVNRLSARHISVITRDGKEHLIPNELFITERVENWSYSDRNVRLKIPLGISYKSDPRLALKLMLEAADETQRILKYPKPNALVRGFGDSAIDLELRAWIDDPVNGIGNISSALMLNIWDKFKENGIEIPYPQRDVHVKNDEPIKVKMAG